MAYMTHSTCPTCGVGVYEYANSYFDPVEGTLLTREVDGTEPEERFVYLPHVCRDARIEAHSELVDSIANQLETLSHSHHSEFDQADYEDAQAVARLSSDALKTAIATLSLHTACPKCDATIGAQCQNLTARKKGQLSYTKSPHDERRPDTQSAAGRELGALRAQASADQGVLTEIYEALNAEDALVKLMRIVRAQRR